MMWNYASDGETRNRRLAHKDPSSILLILYSSDGSDICLKLYINFFPLEYILKKKKTSHSNESLEEKKHVSRFCISPIFGWGVNESILTPARLTSIRSVRSFVIYISACVIGLYLRLPSGASLKSCASVTSLPHISSRCLDPT